MTKPKRSRSQRLGGRRENLVVWYERIGEYYDDVLVTLEYDERAVAAIRALPHWAQHWDATSNVWRIHPGYARRLVAALRQLGYTVCGGWSSMESQTGAALSSSEGNVPQLARPGSGARTA